MPRPYGVPPPMKECVCNGGFHVRPFWQHDFRCVSAEKTTERPLGNLLQKFPKFCRLVILPNHDTST